MNLQGGSGVTRVLLADRRGTGRAALAALLCDIPGVVLVGEVGEADALEPAVRDMQPDLVLVDDRLLTGAMNGVERMIVIGLDDDPGFAQRARRLGAITWIPKEHADALLPPMLSDPRGSWR
jgi:DNA-binding NarL/FixJ family response regulator